MPEVSQQPFGFTGNKGIQFWNRSVLSLAKSIYTKWYLYILICHMTLTLHVTGTPQTLAYNPAYDLQHILIYMLRSQNQNNRKHSCYWKLSPQNQFSVFLSFVLLLDLSQPNVQNFHLTNLPMVLGEFWGLVVAQKVQVDFQGLILSSLKSTPLASVSIVA